MFRFGICTLASIDTTATTLTRNILLGSATTIDATIETLLITGVSRIYYSRSVALLARQIHRTLSCYSATLARRFRDKLVDEVIGAYFEFWAEELHPSTPQKHSSYGNTPKLTNPFALSAFIGDLRYAELISFGTYEWMMMYLLHRLREPYHLQSLQLLLAHGCSQHQPEVSSAYLERCGNIVWSRCQRFFKSGCISEEERQLHTLLSELSLIAQHPEASWTVTFDRRLTLERVLISASCSSSALEPVLANSNLNSNSSCSTDTTLSSQYTHFGIASCQTLTLTDSRRASVASSCTSVNTTMSSNVSRSASHAIAIHHIKRVKMPDLHHPRAVRLIFPAHLEWNV
ncbi:hypothetical protein BDN70DRAFT_988137 [Pholiota conissans]|uniref:Uncharacterized protein n=1 Tax=Pholiota conissans TaxID=109636 RepID=A0A9P5ZET1_9AGAR|nr:hypothetical protein BDN70DRAFT_988137 [Pholiota conissans]